ncbi:hypothetical protein POM88_025352 [Heracleum sosnowskyi]|uniref:Carbohydrate kinase PfkB domain-containing protein n=1 Tax=Heracleum sosnowskyi TaxID=360622 RepID=A0AAD8I4H3_9APIA|nr:hypothetical protein POM88_025352 [Heracleum sosnowskyi]
MAKGPGLYSDIGKRARDLFNKDYQNDQKFTLSTCSATRVIPSLDKSYFLFYPGGVARNVAHCVSMLGTRPYMISAMGHDMPGNLLLEHWKSNALPVEGIRRGKDIETAVVCNMFDSEGELAAAVASVAAAVPANAKKLMFRNHLTS